MSSVDLGPLLAAVRDEWETGKAIAQRAGIDTRTSGPRLMKLVRAQLAERRWTDGLGGVYLYKRGHLAPALHEQEALPLDRSTGELVADAIKAFEIAESLARMVAACVAGGERRLASSAASSAQRSAGRLRLVQRGEPREA